MFLTTSWKKIIPKPISSVFKNYLQVNKKQRAVYKMCRLKITDEDATTSNFNRYLKLHKEQEVEVNTSIVSVLDLAFDSGLLHRQS